VKYHYWTETNTNYTVGESIVGSPTMQDTHTTLRLNSDTVIRSVWNPRLDVRTDRASGAPTPYWWVGATVSLVVVFDFDSSFPLVNINLGGGDPRTMGHVRLVPRAMTYDSSFDTVVTFYPEGGPLNLEGRRKGSGADIIPSVQGYCWGFDNYGVLDFSHSTHTVTRWSNTSRVLWASDQAPA